LNHSGVPFSEVTRPAISVARSACSLLNVSMIAIRCAGDIRGHGPLSNA
jgi:hypothetical protein